MQNNAVGEHAGARLSIVVLSSGGTRELSRCLQSLLEDDPGTETEIAVLVRGASPETDALRERYAALSWIRVAATTSLPEMRRLGLEESSGDIVVLLSSAYTPTRGWLASLAQTGGEARKIVGSRMRLPDSPGYVALAVALMEYGEFLAPSSGTTEAVVVHCAAYDSEILRRLTPTELSSWEPRFLQAARDNGAVLVSRPSAEALVRDRATLGWALRQRFHHLRCIGNERLRDRALVFRAFRALAAPVLALTGLVAVLGRLRRVPGDRLRQISTLPVLVCLATAGALGEAFGALGSRGRCEIVE